MPPPALPVIRGRAVPPARYGRGDSFTYNERATGDPSPQIQWDPDGITFRMVRQFFVRPGTMGAIYGAAKFFRGYPTTLTFNQGGNFFRYVSRQLPDIVPWVDLPDGLFAVGVSARQPANDGLNPTSNGDGYNEYSEELVTVEYRGANYTVLDDADCVNYIAAKNRTIGYFASQGFNFPDEGLLLRYVERNWRFAGHVVKIPGGYTCVEVDDGGDLGKNLQSGLNYTQVPYVTGYPFRESFLELTYVHREVPLSAVPSQTILKSVNTVNSALFDPSFWAIPAGCSLFIGGQPRVGKLVTGEAGVNMEYKFIVAPNLVRFGSQANTFGGWNRALTVLFGGPNVGQVDYRPIRAFTLAGGAGQTVLQSADHTALFRPDQNP